MKDVHETPDNVRDTTPAGELKKELLLLKGSWENLALQYRNMIGELIEIKRSELRATEKLSEQWIDLVDQCLLGWDERAAGVTIDAFEAQKTGILTRLQEKMESIRAHLTTPEAEDENPYGPLLALLESMLERVQNLHK